MSEEHLKRRIGALTEQVKLLVRTEQRLNLAQRSLEAQLQRMAELNDFALAASAAADDGEVLDHALGLILRLHPYDQAVALLPDEDGVLHARRVAALEGRLGDAARRLEAGGPRGVGAAALPDEPTIVAPPGVEGIIALVDALFAEPGVSSSAHAVLLVPLRLQGHVEGLLVARKLDGVVSYARPLPRAEDLPLLRLLASHVQGALDGVRMRARVASIVTHLPSAIFLLSGGRVVQSNEAARRLLALGPDEPSTGLAFVDLVPASERDAYAQLEQRVAREGSLRLLERRLVTRAGAVRPVELTALPVTFEGRPGALVIADDVAERLRTRSELAFTQRLATVGSLAAGVAHEINNPLTYVLHHLQTLARRVAEADRPAAQAAIDGATRIRDIVRDLQTFARPGGDVAEAIDVDAVLDKVLALAAPELRYRAGLTVVRGAVSPARATEGRLAQVFLNLVINAVRAMAEGDAENNELHIETRMEGDRVVIAFSDNGKGIAPTDLARIFEPFFTTDASTGSGLGLTICQNIITAFGGTLDVTSALGRGTTFVVRLPAAEARPAEAPPARTLEARARARVLVVDDDARLLQVLAALLEPSHDVVTASGGAAALAWLDGGAVDVVLCDLMMPGVSGMDVFEWIERRRPELASRVVFMTGGAVTPRSRDLLERTTCAVLMKPMELHELLAAIDAARGDG